MTEIVYRPVGVVHSGFREPRGTPIQPSAAQDTQGTVEIYPEYTEGLQDVEGFSHITLIYHFHKAKKPALKVKPYMDDKLHGVFATRAPARPNPIGISTVQLLKIEDNTLHIRNVDILDGTPLLDIKPYIPEFDAPKTQKKGWLKKHIHKLPKTKDNGRFTQ